MKKKLLITLGCSFTEGVGCYEPSLLDEKGKPINSNNVNMYGLSRDRFHSEGWPAKLQKKLQYDCMWNLGKGGTANSESVKKWIERFSNKNLSEEYDVLVLWMVTFSTRISFYRNSEISSILTNFSGLPPVYKNLSESYINFLGDGIKDSCLESYFYVSVIENLCRLSNYNFLYINVAADEGQYLDSFMQSSSSLNAARAIMYPEHHGILHGFITDSDLDTVAWCGHPNEKGYDMLAERLFNLISHNHPHLINSIPPEKYEMQYLGDPKVWEYVVGDGK